jgi:hypothetical protein
MRNFDTGSCEKIRELSQRTSIFSKPSKASRTVPRFFHSFLFPFSFYPHS